jgi:hypothetical protein
MALAADDVNFLRRNMRRVMGGIRNVGGQIQGAVEARGGARALTMQGIRGIRDISGRAIGSTFGLIKNIGGRIDGVTGGRSGTVGLLVVGGYAFWNFVQNFPIAAVDLTKNGLKHFVKDDPKYSVLGSVVFDADQVIPVGDQQIFSYQYFPDEMPKALESTIYSLWKPILIMLPIIALDRIRKKEVEALWELAASTDTDHSIRSTRGNVNLLIRILRKILPHNLTLPKDLRDFFEGMNDKAGPSAPVINKFIKSRFFKDSRYASEIFIAALREFPDLNPDKHGLEALRDEGGNTLAHIAAICGSESHLNLIKHLRSINFYFGGVNKDGITALSLAKQNGHHNIAKEITAAPGEAVLPPQYSTITQSIPVSLLRSEAFSETAVRRVKQLSFDEVKEGRESKDGSDSKREFEKQPRAILHAFDAASAADAADADQGIGVGLAPQAAAPREDVRLANDAPS